MNRENSMRQIEDELDILIHDALEQKLFSGLALGVCLDQTTLFKKYYGFTNFSVTNHSVDSETLFDLASLTKILATTAITLRFIDRGLIELNNKISHFFPEATASKDITILQLLTHTSGEPAHFLLEKETQSVDEVQKLLLNRPLAYKSGTKEEYSCMGFILLGEVLKKVSGKTLDYLFEKEVKEPLKLNTAGYTPEVVNNICSTKDFEKNQILSGIVHDENARYLNGISANAGLFSNLDDLLIFSKMLLKGGLTASDDIFIQPNTIDMACQNYTPGYAENRGLGFFLGCPGSSFGKVLEKGSFGHTGFTGTSLLINPKRHLGVVILTNRILSDIDSGPIIRFRSSLHDYLGTVFTPD